MDIYLCDHCHIEFGCDSSTVICSHCGAEQTPPAYKIQPMEHAVMDKHLFDNAARKTRLRPVPRLARKRNK